MTLPPHVLLVTCRPNGQLVRIVHGIPALREALHPASLLHVIDAVDADAFWRFMQSISGHGHAFDWKLRVLTPAGLRTMQFAGITDNSECWVAAAEEPAAVLALLAQAERELGSTAPRPQIAPSMRTLLDDLSRVNSELVNLQRELCQRNATLVEVTRERNQLLGIAAHDLRNPIMVVQSYCELLLSTSGGALGTAKTAFVERVHEAADAMLRLLEDTLDYSRFASAEVKLDTMPTDLSRLVKASVLDYQPLAARKHIGLSFHPPAQTLPAVPLDGTKIERVVVNLLSNAIKYSDTGAAVHVYVDRSDRFARVTVCDGGRGIADEDVSSLFLPFHTGSTPPSGGEQSTGLGLAIVKKLVEAHGGHVAVSSRQHHGSSFSFELPFEPPRLFPDTVVPLGH